MNRVGPRGAKLESQWTKVDGLRLHARVSTNPLPADAPAVVLVHGVGVSSRYLIPTAERLAEEYRVYAPDLPGFGKSDKPAQVLNITELAEALEGWRRAAGPPHASFLGNSLGCQTIVAYCLRFPERVEKAILVGPTADPQAGGVLGLIGRGALDLLGESPALWPLLVYDYLIAGPARTVRTLRYAVDEHVEAKLPRVQVPTLVVRGSRDTVATRRWVEEMVRRLPAGRLVELPGAPHAANFSAPEKLVPVVRAFLREPWHAPADVGRRSVAAGGR